MSQKANRIPENQIPEVQHFLDIRDRVQRLKEAFPEVFEQLDQLAGEYNQALEAADKVVRGKKVSCGPFDLYQWATTYNAEKLHEELGREEFLKVGGQIKTIATYDIDKAKLEAHITSGAIPGEVVDAVRTVSPRFKKPEKINI